MTKWGCGQRPGLAVDADLALLHRLEERGLRTGRRAVELVDQHDVREDGPGPEVPCAGVGHEHRHPRDVGREEVGVALDPRQLGAEGGGEAAGQHRLAHAGHVLNEEMPARERGDRGGDRAPPSLPSTTCSRLLHQGLAERDGVRPGRGRARRRRSSGHRRAVGHGCQHYGGRSAPPVLGLTLRQAGSGCAGAPSRAEPSPLRRSWGPGPEAIAPNCAVSCGWGSFDRPAAGAGSTRRVTK